MPPLCMWPQHAGDVTAAQDRGKYYCNYPYTGQYMAHACTAGMPMHCLEASVGCMALL